MSRSLHVLLSAALILGMVARPARADGAFPDEMSVLTPAIAPHRVLVGANFGLVVSEDDGATWRYVCEPYISAAFENVFVYHVGPDGAVLAAHGGNLARSGDVGCTWTQATGAMAGQTVVDAFVDPHDASFVLAIGWAVGGGSSIYPSHDGGRTFGPAVYTTQERLLSIEFAASTVGVVYATAFTDSTTGSASLIRTSDSGTSWTRSPLATPPRAQARIAAVEPQDANLVYLRISNPAPLSDALAIYDQRTQTASVALQLSNIFSSFARAPDSTLFVGTTQADLWTRPPNATSFTRMTGPHLRCLGLRGTQLLGCGDGALDGFNLGASDDGGRTFRALLRFRDIQGPASCAPVQTACASDWNYLRQLFAGPPEAPPAPTLRQEDAIAGPLRPARLLPPCSPYSGGAAEDGAREPERWPSTRFRDPRGIPRCAP